MNKPGDSQHAYFDRTMYGLNAQAIYQEKLVQSKVMRQYIMAIEKNITTLREAIAEGDFDTLLAVEQATQKVEMERFSHDESMVASIQKTQNDLAEGVKDYRQLLEIPKIYFARGYRKEDCTGSNKQFPIDTMRKALRSQATRVGNFAKNPMLFQVEKEFHQLRVSLLKRAEKLYVALQAQAIAANAQQEG